MATDAELDGLIAHSQAVTVGLQKMKTAPSKKAILVETFDGGKAIALRESFLASHYEPTTQIQKYAFSDRWYAQYYALKGTNERTPIQFECDHDMVFKLLGQETFQEFWMDWFEYFPAAYPFPSSGQKILRVGYDHGQHPESKKDFTFATLNDNTNVQASWYLGQWGDKTYGVVDQGLNSGKPHPLAAWVNWRIGVKLNTPGSADGFVRVYQNSKLFTSMESQNIRGADSRGYNQFWWGGNYSNLPGGVLKGSGIRRMANFSWYGTDPK